MRGRYLPVCRFLKRSWFDQLDALVFRSLVHICFGKYANNFVAIYLKLGIAAQNGVDLAAYPPTESRALELPRSGVEICGRDVA